MPCTCQTLQTFKSGWAVKSPPQEKIRKIGHRFMLRWFTLSIVEACEEKKKSLMLSYFKDQEETDLKGK